MAEKERAVQAGNIGAWIVQGNPQRVWRYFDFREVNELVPGDAYVNDWTLHPSYRVDLMGQGDLVVLWLTGVRRGDYWPGVYEIGVLNGPAEPSFGMDHTHKVDPSMPDTEGFVVEFDSYILPRPLRTVDLRDDPVLAESEKFRVPMLGNPLFLTPRETYALSRYLTSDDLEQSGWGDYMKLPYFTEATE